MEENNKKKKIYYINICLKCPKCHSSLVTGGYKRAFPALPALPALWTQEAKTKVVFKLKLSRDNFSLHTACKNKNDFKIKQKEYVFTDTSFLFTGTSFLFRVKK